MSFDDYAAQRLAGAMRGQQEQHSGVLKQRRAKRKIGGKKGETLGQAGGDEARRQFAETEQAYGGRAGYERAKQAGRTKLTYGQWVQVRTPNFKRWFGDWEIGRVAERHANTFAKAREHANAFKGRDLVNGATGLVARVSRNSLDKMLNEKAVGQSESPAAHAAAVANLDSLFERALLG